MVIDKMRIPIVSKWWNSLDFYSQAGIGMITVCVVGWIFFPITIPIALYYGYQEKKEKEDREKQLANTPPPPPYVPNSLYIRPRIKSKNVNNQ